MHGESQAPQSQLLKEVRILWLYGSFQSQVSLLGHSLSHWIQALRADKCRKDWQVEPLPPAFN